MELLLGSITLLVRVEYYCFLTCESLGARQAKSFPQSVASEHLIESLTSNLNLTKSAACRLYDALRK